MHDKELYAAILGIRSPWLVTRVELDAKSEQVSVLIEAQAGSTFECPTCSKVSPGYDTRRRSWRHLDTCQFKTILVAEVPRVRCAEHGVLQIAVPWAEAGSGFTALMEALVINWLKEASIQAVARRMKLTWDQIDGIMQRAVKRGLARRTLGPLARLCVDETSFQKRHEYVTIVTNLEGNSVVYVADGRNQAALDGFWAELTPDQLAAIEAVAMDMCAPYIRSTKEHLPGADEKICFDRFHVARAINEAVNTVRKQEHRELCAIGDPVLKGTKYVWVKNPENRTEIQESLFNHLRDSGLKVARAWAIKELARSLWSYVTRGWAKRAWEKWISWAMRCRLEPMRRVAKTVRAFLWGILNAIKLDVTSAAGESINAKIQRVKDRSCGFRSRERFRNAIYFHCGGLDLYPGTLRATHTTS
jgi:transposase